jgi:hypothetical protein
VSAPNGNDRRGAPAHTCPHGNPRCGTWRLLQRPHRRWTCSRLCELLITARARALAECEIEELCDLIGNDIRTEVRAA